MSQRERYLAIAVAVVVGLFGAQYVFNTVTKTLRDKQDAVDMARSESEDMDKTVTSGKIAVRKMEMLTPKSLPTDQETLVAQYRDWLTELGKSVDMDGIDVDVPERPIRTNDAYAAYNFSLHGICRTDRLLDLMGAFYDKDYLHTIKDLKITLSSKETDVVTVRLDSQAIALTSAAPKQEPSSEPSGRLAMSMDEYKDAILGRNPFAPPNQPPKFSTSRTHTLERGKDWSLAMESKDAESHRVEYVLVSEELPEGMRFRRGSFNWRPEENGKYEVVVKAVDSGWPSMETEERFVLNVVDPKVEEPKVEPPKFDVASQAFVTAILGGRDGKQVWIRSRTSGETLVKKEGADFELGSIKARIVSINLNEDFVELETEGRHWTLDMDTSLAEAYRQSEID